MSQKRTDNKGRILKTGESQRKNLTYQYRYKDVHGKQKTIYAPTLKVLREKESEIQKQLALGVDYNSNNMTVADLMQQYMSIKTGIRYQTQRAYTAILNMLRQNYFGNIAIDKVKMLDAKHWILELYQSGKAYGTVRNIRGIMCSAFRMAVQEDMVRKNPFDFKLFSIIKDDIKPRVALTKEQQEDFVAFIKTDKIAARNYDVYMILLETGMRISEMCGLRKEDIDLEKRQIKINHQLSKKSDGTFYVAQLKTANGHRTIPMTDIAYKSFCKVIKTRPHFNREVVIDGYTNFLFVNDQGVPKTSQVYDHAMRTINRRLSQTYPHKAFPHITPHTLRHTFCTNMVYAGVDVKTIQYLMGHAKADLTLNVYTHTNYEQTLEQMNKCSLLQQIGHYVT